MSHITDAACPEFAHCYGEECEFCREPLEDCLCEEYERAAMDAAQAADTEPEVCSACGGDLPDECYCHIDYSPAYTRYGIHSAI